MASIHAFRRKAKGTPLTDICIDLYARGEMKNRLKDANNENLSLRASLCEERDRYDAIVQRAEEAEAQLRILTNSPIQPSPAGRVRWTSAEYEFLAGLYDANPKAPNTMLAPRCSDQFGRLITTASITSALDRLRKKGRLPKYKNSSLAMRREPNLATAV
jgi:hypothetical protein